MNKQNNDKTDIISRRDFIKTSAVAGTASFLVGRSRLFAAGSDKLRVGLIGCGGRGTGAAMDCFNSSANVEIAAMGDLFQNRLDDSLKRLGEELPDHPAISKDQCFVGWDAYQKVIDSGVDMVILACPPQFRHKHLAAAIEAGKHVFMEKPVAVDPVGIRSIIKTSDLARKKGLAIVAGTQRRHQGHYLEIMKRVHDGAIGEIVSAQCYWNGGSWNGPGGKPEGMSDVEYQIRNWFHFVWLSGDEIVEQHVHNIDAVTWAIGATPQQAYGMGGRQLRGGDGNIYDHFAVEFEYPNGIKVLSMCRHMDGCTDRVSERIMGTKGSVYLDGAVGWIEGPNAYKYEGDSPNPYVQEHADLIRSIREGNPLNEGRQVAESTLIAIMGRMSAYTGHALKWDWVMNVSQLDLSPPEYKFGDLEVRPLSVPGKTELI
ncbi:MAG: Gfo/Idh/MocA family oxidoreductase [Sedimentisphaerales bacterium]|nr:Gfo/Idh/MocA family oxidoreductase [Sedimentisphaerales bacterium]